ncbi:chloramphenicol acetyltransferase [Bacillus sp. NEB1478]|uniref:chloramphenicol acetyltransferase n=1 Tax=Bacillus sp. NEB1478 TaxID=3073816 RepID=UPI0028736C67|nr:chloramphenicol acetyltransferase [Bacillus sp. NEB1478]WNB90869.1 chloramphenicol acetyltransferase [Bacillus sp. NEB1478]
MKFFKNIHWGDSMSLICFEGASAVGKTTTSNELAKRTNTYVIPEVNLLFERPKSESKTWYLERQVDRWLIAQEKLKTYETVLLDGDIFQPLSYNWCFDFKLFDLDLSFIAEFYRNEIKEKNIGFPDKYFYLYTDKNNLIHRKENDVTRKRGNFEQNLEIVEPHKQYYNALNSFIPDYVHLIEAKSVEEIIIQIIDHIPRSPVTINSLHLFDEIENWLTNNKVLLQHK